MEDRVQSLSVSVDEPVSLAWSISVISIEYQHQGGIR